MPILTVKKERFWRLLGKRLNDEELVSLLHDLALDVEEVSEEYFRVEYNPNRPDYSSPIGLARAAKGLLGLEVGAPRYELQPSKTYIDVDPRLKDVRPYVVSAIVRGIELDADQLEEVIAMQEDLHWILGRDRRKVAIGLHNLDAVKPPFHYIAARGDEVKFTPLGYWREMTLEEILERHEKGIQYAHIIKGKPYYPLIVDSRYEVLSFPPIINSTLTELSEETKNLFIEITGTDLDSMNKTLNILTTAFSDMGGRVERVEVRYDGERVETPNYDVRAWRIRPDYVNEVLGLNLKPNEIVKALKAMRHDVEVMDEVLVVHPPPYRADIMHPIDLVEDVAMGLRYSSLKPKQPETLTYGRLHVDTVLEEVVREVMIGMGYTEVMNFTLTNEEEEYGRMGVEPHPHVKILNPVSAEYTILRTWILPSLMKNLSYNRGSLYPQRIFEVGDVIYPAEDVPEKAVRRLRLGAVSSHKDSSYTEIKSVLEELLRNLMIEGYELEPYDLMPFIEGRAAEIFWRGRSLGFMGELHPEILTKWGLTMPTAALEIDLTTIQEVRFKQEN
ncbi:MAG: phenylalanine--tRNA ligase subunit beta [Thaumarchaeota archaeon]|nr:phenylalanine--tRNA ligase subunit beta [Nitrososphaerota archaeon]